jgi:hypothetical protein
VINWMLGEEGVEDVACTVDDMEVGGNGVRKGGRGYKSSTRPTSSSSCSMWVTQSQLGAVLVADW